MSHTPTPWYVQDYRKNWVAAEGPVSETNGGYTICECHGPESVANAQLIVTAVNSHQKLVDALKECLEFISQVADKVPDEFYDPIHPSIVGIREVMDKNEALLKECGA